MRDYVEPVVKHTQAVLAAGDKIRSDNPGEIPVPGHVVDCEGFSELRVFVISHGSFGQFSVEVYAGTQDNYALDAWPLTMPAVLIPDPDPIGVLSIWTLAQTIDLAGAKAVAIAIRAGGLEVRDLKARAFLLR